MKNPHTLIKHRDIQNWVNDKRGTPAIARVRDNFGEVKARLGLSFARQERQRVELTEPDGLTPVSWTAWLAELDRQQLALKVSGNEADYEFVERRADNFQYPSQH